MMDPGKLDQRITLRSKSVTRTGMGEEVVTWVDVAQVWAEAKALRGREYFAASQAQSAVDITFRVRDRYVQPEWRVRWQGNDYDIKAIIPGTGPLVGLVELMCVRGERVQ